MSRSQLDRLRDIRAACQAIAEYAAADDERGLVFDAMRIRLVEIGEAVKDLDPATRELAPGIPWDEIARMRDLLTHRYFDATHAIVFATARTDVPVLSESVERMIERLDGPA
ncbi:DUF86 domain-containing protein [Agromyces sp. MMS24-JH15]|uniref:HepT-like ribonuclease domain-containing protein n=1 Tax=Agromyces sp. MMS24-JH15 TaxID=3243765 RepID=UPI003747BB8E